MPISTTRGTKIYIGSVASPVGIGSSQTLAMYQADTSYVEVGEVEDLGELGDESAEVTFSTIGNDGRVRRMKGGRDGGTLTLVCGRDPRDAGQAALIAAEKNTLDDFHLKIVLDDAPVEGTPTTFFARVMVLSTKVNFGGADDVTRINFTLGINSEVLEVEAEEA